MPTLVLITGAQAVGKMTVGQALARLTGIPLFYNHQIIDLVNPYFAFGTTQFDRIVDGFWDHLVESAAETQRGLIVTWAWRFDQPEDTARVEQFAHQFLQRGGKACVVELHAPLATRLERNRTEHRRRHKNTDWATDEALRDLSARFEYSSGGTLPLDLPHLVLDVTDLTPEEAATRIVECFGLPPSP